jgi:hypothetical protein
MFVKTTPNSSIWEIYINTWGRRGPIQLSATYTLMLHVCHKWENNLIQIDKTYEIDKCGNIGSENQQ